MIAVISQPGFERNGSDRSVHECSLRCLPSTCIWEEIFHGLKHCNTLPESWSLHYMWYIVLECSKDTAATDSNESFGRFPSFIARVRDGKRAERDDAKNRDFCTIFEIKFLAACSAADQSRTICLKLEGWWLRWCVWFWAKWAIDPTITENVKVDN